MNSPLEKKNKNLYEDLFGSIEWNTRKNDQQVEEVIKSIDTVFEPKGYEPVWQYKKFFKDRYRITVDNVPEENGIYFLSCGALVKIGCSKNLKTRVRKHIGGYPFLKLLGCVCYSSFKEAKNIEEYIGIRLESRRIAREWFVITEEEQKSIVDILCV